MKYELKTKYRTAFLSIEELPEKVCVFISYSKLGKFNDAKEIREWHRKIIVPYDQDPRPLEFHIEGYPDIIWSQGEIGGPIVIVQTPKEGMH